MSEDGWFAFWLLLCIGVSTILVIGGVIGWEVAQHNVEELGQAICEDHFDADFESYVGGVLSCEERQLETFDGLQVKIVGGKG